MTVHLIPFLMSEGYGRSFAAGAAGAVGLLALPGRLVFTPLGSVIQRRYVTALIFLLQALSLLLLLVSQSTPGIVAFVILFGAGFGAITPARAALVAEAYGPAHYGSISGVFALCVTASRAAAPVGAGLVHAWSGGYAAVLWSLAAVSALAVVAALQVRPPRREPAGTPIGDALGPQATEGVNV
jgi:predicted MFS family arabinose efflux permease